MAYLDERSKPILRHSVCGFLDVLGFSALSTMTSSREDAQRVLESIADAIHDSRTFVRETFGSVPAAAPSQWALKFFSDNLVFGFPVDRSSEGASAAIRLALRCVQGYQLQMALNGFFVRGAIDLGDICLTDEIIFGPALIECYRLESKASIVPRVIVSEGLRAAVEGIVDAQVESKVETLSSVCRDVDGWWFVNYLEVTKSQDNLDWTAIHRHKRAVLSSLAETTRHDVLPKYGWTRRYHNVFCHWHQRDPGYSPAFLIERSDEQSTIQRLSDTRGQRT
jgi:hypothetical protein